MHSQDAFKKVEEGIETLSKELEKGKSENLKRFLATAARFHRYSMNNLFLIMSQAPTATRVAGYQTWQSLGRQVLMGSKAIKILAPRKGKRQVVKDGETVNHESLYFVTVNVFDVSQTGGDELPGIFRANGDPGKHLGALESFITSKGITLSNASNLQGALGVSQGGSIEVLDSLNPTQRFTTLVHELAHEMLHRDEAQSNLSKAQKETEAEAVGYIVGQACDVDTLGQTADYVQLWAGDVKLFKACLGRIQKCAREILDNVLSE